MVDDNFLDEQAEESISDIIRRKITYRVLLSLFVLFAFLCVTLIYELNSYIEALKYSTYDDYKLLEQNVLAQILADNTQAVNYAIKNINASQSQYKIYYIKDTHTIRTKARFTFGFTWSIAYPSLQFNGHNYGYIIYKGRFYRSQIFQRFLLLLLGYILVFVLATIVIYPVYKRVPRDLIISPIFYMLEIIRKKEKIKRDDAFNALPTEIKDILYSVENLVEEVETSTQLAATYKFATRVAHDIRSPLAVLNSVVDEYRQTKHFDFETITAVSRRISKIANDIVTQINPKNRHYSIIIPYLVIKEVLNEKHYLTHNFACQFIFNAEDEVKSLFCQANGLELGRALSNLLNNAMEAVKENGSVTVNLKYTMSDVIIEINDNGVGMSEQVRNSVLAGNIISTKTKGTGIGLKSALEYVHSLNGVFDIESTLGQGTTIRIQLPLAKTPSWFMDSLVIDEKDSVLVVDDEPIIYDHWQEKLSNIALNMHYISGNEKSVKTFDYIRESNYNLYFLDYQNPYLSKDGVEMIKEYQLKEKGLLVTSNYDDPLLQEICVKEGVKMLPKAFISELNVEGLNSAADIILFDDDVLFAKSFRRQAELQKRNVQVFSHIFNFSRCLSLYAHKDKITVYLDLTIEKQGDGLLFAEMLGTQGFKQIYVLSGQEDIDMNSVPACVSKVYSKAHFDWEVLRNG